MKRSIIILIILTIIHLPFSCTNTCSPEPAVKISELTSYLGSFFIDESVTPFHQFEQTIATNYENAAIQILITDTDKLASSEGLGNTFSLINPCYACEAVIMIRPISSITITSDSVVYSKGKKFSSGEDLTELFKVYLPISKSIYYSTSQLSVSEFINTRNYEFYFREVNSFVVFQLTNKPDSIINQKLTFLFEFEDSEKIEVKTPIFEVTK